jgi:O-methyltransferase involved in polyketide biosynthesis
LVAVSRALASQGPDALLNDPLADPLVRAVGLDPFIRVIDGELTVEDDPHGFEFPDNELTAAFPDMSYVAATLK